MNEKKEKQNEKFYQSIYTFFEISLDNEKMSDNKKHALREYLKKHLREYYKGKNHENSKLVKDVDVIWNSLSDADKKIYRNIVQDHIIEKYLDISARKKIEKKLGSDIREALKDLSDIEYIVKNQEIVRYIEYYNPEKPKESYDEITKVCEKFFSTNFLPSLEEWKEDNNERLKHSAKYNVEINSNFSCWRKKNPSFKDWFDSLGDLKEILKKDYYSKYELCYKNDWSFNDWFDNIRYGTLRIHDYLEDAVSYDQSERFPGQSQSNRYIIENIIKALSRIGITILKDEIEKDLYTICNKYPSKEFEIANWRLSKYDYFIIEEKENGNAID
uniref:hypothetical protein n=1 Tax=Anaerococcus mediterraneensis TaxID=1870984 RepID=UPI000930846F|nr:hypothetical protein [Anaerococcus mediterraneensis]